jgi:hypothetical protein
MNGLRVYIDQKTPGTWRIDRVFYTRRAGGPYYRWRYEELLGRWLCSRMHSFDLPMTELVAAPWKELPTALKVSLGEHYVD